MVRIGNEKILFLIDDSMVSPEPLVCLPSEYRGKPRISGDNAVVSVAVAVSFADDRVTFYLRVEPVQYLYDMRFPP